MVERKHYLAKLNAWKDEKVIKVITGLRRCGKSTLLLQYQDILREQGIMDHQIISINFEDLDFEDYLDYKKLYAYLKTQIQTNETYYIFLDEIQKVAQFEKVVDSLYIKDNIDLYITGSNAYMLSGDLATLLTGRYVEISMLPLSFSEYLELTGLSLTEGFGEYLRTGGLPYVAQMDRTKEKIDMYLEGIYNTVIVKDIENRQAANNQSVHKRKIADIALLKDISKYLSSVIGSLISIRNITNYLVSSGRKVSYNTVSDYLEALHESFIFYPVDRFDIVGKQLLKTNQKWYMVDLGIRNHILPRKEYDFGFSIENIVYLELLRRGYKVNIGKFGTGEVDFVVQKQGRLTYVQVTADLVSKETFEREISPLKKIKDNYSKIILTSDRFTLGNYDGIEVINVMDWLLDWK